MKNKRQIFTTILSILISVFLVATAVYAVTIIGENVSVGGNLTVNGTISEGGTSLSDKYVPYTGATADVDLGIHSLFIGTGGIIFTGPSGIGTIYPSDTVGGLLFAISGEGTNYQFQNLNSHRGILDFESLTVDRTFTFPDASGTLALREDTGVVRKLATVENLDLKTLGETLLYTVPVNTKLFITEVLIRRRNVVNPVYDATFIGKRGSDNNELFNNQMWDLTQEGRHNIFYYGAGIIATALSVNGGDTVKLEVTNVDSGDTFTVDVDLIGYLIEE